MKVVCSDKTIDLDKFDKVQFKLQIDNKHFAIDCGYPVEAIRKEANNGLFGGTTAIKEEIAMFASAAPASRLVEDITKAWINNEASFDVNEWLKH